MNFFFPCVNHILKENNTRLNFLKGQPQGQLIFQNWFICGQLNPSTHCINQYFITFIDDKFKYIMIYLWKHKYETFANF